MATNENQFSSKVKQFFTNRAVVVTAVTLLVATGIIVAATVAANRAKKPITEDTTPGTTIVTQGKETDATPSVKDEVTLPTYNEGETQPVVADPEDEEAMLALPVTGKMFKGHDATLQVYSNTMGDYRVHLGVDIATDPEAPVYAAADGEVEKIWQDAMMGTCVAITHEDDTVSIYKNLAKDLTNGIEVGTAVKRGQQIGNVGDTAVVEMADDPHLHFEVTVGGLSVDPLDYFSEEAAASLTEDAGYEDDAIRPDGK